MDKNKTETLPSKIELFGGGRDASTRQARRAARFQRRSFRVGGELLIRPGRGVMVNAAFIERHRNEILSRMREGVLLCRVNGRPLTIEELSPPEGVAPLLRQLVALSAKAGHSPPPTDWFDTTMAAFEEMSEEQKDEALSELTTRIAELEQEIAESENSEPEEEEGEPEEEKDEPITEISPGTADTQPPGNDTKPQGVPRALALPEGFEKHTKAQLLTLFEERADFALAVPEDTRNDTLIRVLQEWSNNVVFED